MAQREFIRKRMLLSITVTLVVGFLLYLVLDEDSFLRAFFSPDTAGLPREGGVLAFLRDYGYWIFVVYVALISVILFLENRNPDRTIAWLLVLGLLPVAGLLFYWFVGPNFRYIADKRRLRLPKPPLASVMPPEKLDNPLVADTASLLYRSGGARLHPAGSVRILLDGEETYDAMLGAMREARQSILLETYILEADRTGHLFKDILTAKAAEGVRVCVIYDAVGGWRVGMQYVRALREAGVHIFAFLPVAFPMFRGANYRNHRKILVVDDTIGFVGGLNICDDCMGWNKKVGPWRDTHLMLRGGGVSALRSIFFKDLAVCGASHELQAELSRREPAPGDHGDSASRARSADPRMTDAIVQIAASGPDTAWDTVQKAYFSLIARATKRVWITTPYLIPGDTLMDALCMAALSGVDVRLLVPGKGDNAVISWATMNCFEELLRAGARIFLYREDSFVHGKTISCDGVVYSVGTANFDTRSLSINFEVQAFVYDNAIAAQGDAIFEKDLANSRELSFAEWSRRPIGRKIKESVGKLISPLA